MLHIGKEIWVKELSGDGWAICFFNNSDNNVDLRINWKHFSILKGEYEIRDLWQKKDLGKTNKNFLRELPSHDAILLKLSPVN